MKQVALLAAFLLLVAMLLAVPVLAHRPHRWPDCRGKTVTLTGPRGEPMECVCFPGILATCFAPGR